MLPTTLPDYFRWTNSHLTSLLLKGCVIKSDTALGNFNLR
jgi:hypothetical protein